MSILLTIVLLALLSPSALAHQGGEIKPTKEVAESYLPQGYSVLRTEATGSLLGMVKTLEGRPVKESLVYLKGVQQGKGFNVTEPLVLDQRDETFSPHVLVVPAGGIVELRNSDSEMHNLHSSSIKNPSFNEGIPEGGTSIRKKFDMVEVVRLGCDIHKEMCAWIVVRDNPYYALTGEDGHFSITEIPPGTYEFLLWHEDLDPKERASFTTKIDIEPNTTLEVDFYLTTKE
jgi:plastocyanin